MKHAHACAAVAVLLLAACANSEPQWSGHKASRVALPPLDEAYRCVGVNKAALQVARRTKDLREDGYLSTSIKWIRAAYFVKKRSEGLNPAQTTSRDFSNFLSDMNNHVNDYINSFRVEIRGDLNHLYPDTKMNKVLKNCLKMEINFIKPIIEPTSAAELAATVDPRQMFCVGEDDQVVNCR